MAISNPIVRFFGWIWRVLNTFRRVLHLILLVLVFAVVLAGVGSPAISVPDSAALIIDPQGNLVEQLAGDPLDRALEELQGVGPSEALVQDVVESLEKAAEDDRIKAVVMRLELMSADGLPKLRAVAAAIRKVRAAGKKVVTLGDGFDQEQYYLAAQGDEIYMNDLGVVYIDGYGYYKTYFKGALDKLQVDLNIFRVGEYKSFVEPYIRDDMSEEDKAASRQWLQAMWAAYQSDVVTARKLPVGSLDDYANNLPRYVEAAEGSTSRVALDRKLVDGLMSRQQFEDYMIGIVGESNDGDSTDYVSIDYRTYLQAMRRTGPPVARDGQVGVIVAAGQIVDGEAAPGTVGGDTLAALIRQAAGDDSVQAVVLRVDSPGGSMFASEVVADELDALKVTGKPLVVSMGSLAASGGYYIATPADEIWADDSTITGSIGVGAIVPTIDRGLDSLGIHVDGIGTTSLAGQLRLDRPLGPEVRNLLEQTVADAYRIFVDKVAVARKMDYVKTEEIARGRVWIGSDARKLGLVDSLGGLDDAVRAAARRAGLEEGVYGTRYLEPELSVAEQVLREYGIRLLTNIRLAGLTLPKGRNTTAEKLVASGLAGLAAVERLNDPRGLYLLCQCGQLARLP